MDKTNCTFEEWMKRFVEYADDGIGKNDDPWGDSILWKKLYDAGKTPEQAWDE